MTSDDFELAVNELIRMKGKAPDEEMLERKIKEIKAGYNMALEVEKEMKDSAVFTYTTIPEAILYILNKANTMNMTCELDSTYNRLRINRAVCEVKSQIDVTYSNNCQMWTVEAKLGHDQFTSTYDGKYGSGMLKATVENLLEVFRRFIR